MEDIFRNAASDLDKILDEFEEREMTSMCICVADAKLEYCSRT